MPKIFALNSLLLVFIICAWLLQNHVIFPLEQLILDPSIVAVASVLFIPAGMKVLFGCILGIEALPAIFLGTSAGMWMYIDDLLFSAEFSFVSTASLYIPILLLNFLEKSPQGDLGLVEPEPINLFRKTVFVAVIASLLNSFFATVLYGSNGHPGAWMHFLVGDIIGTIFIVGAVIIFRRPLYKTLFSLVSNEYTSSK